MTLQRVHPALLQLKPQLHNSLFCTVCNVPPQWATLNVRLCVCVLIISYRHFLQALSKSEDTHIGNCVISTPSISLLC